MDINYYNNNESVCAQKSDAKEMYMNTNVYTQNLTLLTDMYINKVR